MHPIRRPPRRGFGEQPATLAAIQNMFARGEQGGYWPADPQYAYEDSAGTTLASVNGVVGKRTDVALGKHAVQSTTANKPYLRQTPVSGKYWYDSNTGTGALTATFSSSLGSACTIATVTPEGVTIAENQTVGTTYNICPPYNYSSDVLIINRALTAAEKALVTRVMQRSMPALGSELIENGGFDTATTGWAAANSSTSLSAVAGRLRVSMISPYTGVSFLAFKSALQANKYYYAKCKTYGGGGCLPQPRLLIGLSTDTSGGSSVAGVETLLTRVHYSGGSANAYCQIVSATDADGYAEFDDYTVKEIL